MSQRKQKKPQFNLVDRVIEYFAPNAALVRSYARSLLSDELSFEGASRNPRLGNWLTDNGDANATISSNISLLRSRSRDLSRNDPFASAAKRRVISNIVGDGIVADVKGSEELIEAWESWAETTKCDVTDENDLSGIQEAVMNTVYESGSCLIRFRLRRPTKANPFPLQLQLLEPDHLDTSKDSVTYQKGDNYTLNGIEFNSLNKPVAYWLYKKHPGNATSFSQMDSVRVPASEIVHVFRMDRLGQSVGVPWTAPAIVRMHDFHEYESAQLIRQKMAACFMAFMQVPSNSDAAKRFKNKSEKTGGLVEKIEPALIEMLPPGYEVEFASPPTMGRDYQEYSKTMLLGIAAGTGIPYEVLTGDLSKVNFSSARLGWIEFEKELKKWRKRIFLSKLLPVVWSKFLEAAEFMDLDLSDAKCKWIPPRRALLDPEKEIRALVAEIRGGLVSHSEAIISLGRDPDEVYEQTEKDNIERDKRGLVNDADPRKVTNTGIKQADESDDDSESDSGNNDDDAEDEN